MMANVLRWIHVLAGVGWFGLVLAVIFVLVPTLRRLEGDSQSEFLRSVFPRVFRLASVLSATALLAGVALYLELFDWSLQLSPLVDTEWGRSILIGAILGALLTTFHFVVEAKFEPAIRSGLEPADMKRTIRILTLAPRVGVFVLAGTVVAMLYAAHGV